MTAFLYFNEGVSEESRAGTLCKFRRKKAVLSTVACWSDIRNIFYFFSFAACLFVVFGFTLLYM